MELDASRCYRALTTRDARFDGHFFVGVVTTGVYCRPVCPARTPLRRNVSFYASAAAAAEEGFRPCLRCRPEASPGTPAWQGTSATVSRGLRLIDEGALDGSGVDDLAERLGVGDRHLRRLFREHLGATPIAVAQTRRLHFAKRLIDETRLPMTEVAHAAGYSSLRRFNAAVLGTYGTSPTALRRCRSKQSVAGDVLELRLAHRGLLAPADLLRFFAARAIPGVEQVDAHSYRRSAVTDDGSAVVIEILPDVDRSELRLRVPSEAARALRSMVERARRLFDADADPQAIRRQLRSDPLLAAAFVRGGVLRVPGAWDPFELVVRAVLGQQVSVAGANTLAGRLVERFGEPLAAPRSGVTHLFPSPERLARAALGRIGLTRQRSNAIRAIARAMLCGELQLRGECTPEDARRQLLALPGVGPWTAEYVAMRVLRDPDAFPAGDLGLRKAAAAGGKPLSEAALARRSEPWRPWRAYASVALWRSLGKASGG